MALGSEGLHQPCVNHVYMGCVSFCGSEMWAHISAISCLGDEQCWDCIMSQLIELASHRVSRHPMLPLVVQMAEGAHVG